MSNLIRAVDFGNLSDIPALMEAAAAEIRAGERGPMRLGVAVFLDEAEELHVYGWGCEADSLHALGVLACGQAWLAGNKVHRE